MNERIVSQFIVLLLQLPEVQLHWARSRVVYLTLVVVHSFKFIDSKNDNSLYNRRPSVQHIKEEPCKAVPLVAGQDREPPGAAAVAENNSVYRTEEEFLNLPQTLQWAHAAQWVVGLI